MHSRARFLFPLVTCLALLLVAPADAEEWQYDLELYLLAAGLDGTAGVGRVETGVDVGFSEILDNLEAGAMGLLRARKGNWAFLGDAIFIALGAGNEVAEVDVDQLVLEGLGVYMVSDRIGLLFGGRYVDITSEIELLGPVRVKAKGGSSWVDPVIGFGVEAPMTDKWAFYGRFDVGGFGVGSNLSYQAKLNFGYSPSQRYSLIFGYRLLDIDYEDGAGADRFLYNVQTSGPNVGVRFHF